MSVATATNNSLPLHGQMAGPAKPQPRKKFTNDYSISLSKEENEYLFTLLGDRCVVSAKEFDIALDENQSNNSVNSASV